MKRLALVLALCSACATTARQRRATVNRTIAASVIAVGTIAAIGLLYGLIHCAEENGGSCQLPAEGGEATP